MHPDKINIGGGGFWLVTVSYIETVLTEFFYHKSDNHYTLNVKNCVKFYEDLINTDFHYWLPRNVPRLLDVKNWFNINLFLINNIGQHGIFIGVILSSDAALITET